MIERFVVYKDETTVEIMECVVSSRNISLDDAIKAAATEYCMTEEGRQICFANQGFNYTDFIKYVPNEICMKHGFAKSATYETKLVKDYYGCLVNAEDLKFTLDYYELPPDEMHRVINTAIRLAVDWETAAIHGKFGQGIGTKTVDGINNMERLIEWAKEYIETEQSETIPFIRKKLDEQIEQFV